MPNKKGFTLVELVVAAIILSITAAIAIPNYMSNMLQGSTKAAQNNLIAIYNAQKTYYYANNAYCTTAGGICNSNASINATLSLNITDSNFNYSCSNANGFTCTATNTGDAALILTVTGLTGGNPNPIVLLGGAGCATPGAAGCNPSCATDVTSYCPNS